MLGRGAMSAPWIFREIHHYLATGQVPDPQPLAGQWAFIQRHCALAVAHSGEEPHTMAGMRSRLMAYSRGMPSAKHLRDQFSSVTPSMPSPPSPPLTSSPTLWRKIRSSAKSRY